MYLSDMSKQYITNTQFEILSIETNCKSFLSNMTVE